MRSRSREHMKCTCCAILFCKAVSHCIRKSCILKHPYPIYVLVLSEQTNSIELIRLRSTMTLMYSSAFREHTVTNTHKISIYRIGTQLFGASTWLNAVVQNRAACRTSPSSGISDHFCGLCRYHSTFKRQIN